jgi:hypothetical protein
MLTHDDETVADALSIYKKIRETGCHYVGFKDIGLPMDELKELNRPMQEDGHKTMMEVVSLSQEDERRSAASAIEIGVDYLIGGTRRELLKEATAGSGIKLFPCIGNVVGHPSSLRALSRTSSRRRKKRRRSASKESTSSRTRTWEMPKR